MNDFNVNSKRSNGTFAGVLFLFALTLVIAVNKVQATVPVPSGWSLYYSTPVSSGNPGVKIYRRSNPNYAAPNNYDYVTVVDMRRATLRNFTGKPSTYMPNGPGYLLLARNSLSWYWSEAVKQGTPVVAFNGTFFDDQNNPAGVSFGLKADGWLMSYGYENAKASPPYSNQRRAFAFDTNTDTSLIEGFSFNLYNTGWKNIIGGLDVAADKSPTSTAKGRTFVGNRDDDGNGSKETIMFFSSYGTTQAVADNALKGFGATSRMMLDGGTSTGFIYKGTSKVNRGGRIVQAFIVYE